jgi:hypothetical protein
MPPAAGLVSTASAGTTRSKPSTGLQNSDSKGNVVKSFGSGMFIWPMGCTLTDGNVWVTDAVAADGVAMAAKAGVRAGHQVVKFSPEGKVLMTLGEAGVPGDDQYHFKSPSAVAVGANGDIFVADGHGLNENNRVVKYSKEGVIKAWERPIRRASSARCAAIDSRAVFVADRETTGSSLDQEKFLSI